MANLNGQNIGTNYKGILNLNTLNGNLSATLQAVTDGDGNASLLQLSTTSVSFGGSDGLNWDDTNNRLGLGTNAPLGVLHLYKSAATTRMLMDGDAGQSKIITYRTGGLQRFGLYLNNTAESGSNAGSDFAIRAYNDAGTLLNTPIFIKRSNGLVGINNTSPLSQLHVKGASGVADSFRSENNAATIGLIHTISGDQNQIFLGRFADTSVSGSILYDNSSGILTLRNNYAPAPNFGFMDLQHGQTVLRLQNGTTPLSVRVSGASVFSVTSLGAISVATIADSSAPNSSLYFSSTASKLVWKDASGTVNNLY